MTGSRRTSASLPSPPRDTLLTTPSIEPVRMPAGGPVARPLLLIGRILGPAQLVRIGAARREAAAGREIRQRRHHAGDLPEPLGLGRRTGQEPEMRDRAQEPM